MIKAVLFDFFGVLHADTLWGLANLYIPDRTDAQDQELADIARAANYGHIDRDEFWRAASEIYGRELEEVVRERDQMGALDPGLLQVIAELRSRGLKTAIVSNVGAGFLARNLSTEQVDNYFDAIVESGAVGYVKPDRRLFEYVSDQLAIKPEQCLFFDDVQRNVDGARSVGMVAELYTGISSCTQALRQHGL